MSQKIPFLELFAALCRDAELAAAVEGWLVVSAAIDRSSRSAELVVEGAAGAGPNLLAQVQEAVGRCYGLNHVKIEPFTEPEKTEQAEEPPAAAQPESPAEPRPADPFARTEAIRRAAMRQTARPAPAKGSAGTKPQGKAIFGKPVTKAPTPMGELELDMGMVVVEGDVFSVDHRELKKRGAWVVAFDLTDYTGSIRVNNFFPGDEAKPLVDGIKKGMHL